MVYLQHYTVNTKKSENLTELVNVVFVAPWIVVSTLLHYYLLN